MESVERVLALASTWATRRQFREPVGHRSVEQVIDRVDISRHRPGSPTVRHVAQVEAGANTRTVSSPAPRFNRSVGGRPVGGHLVATKVEEMRCQEAVRRQRQEVAGTPENER